MLLILHLVEIWDMGDYENTAFEGLSCLAERDVDTKGGETLI